MTVETGSMSREQTTLERVYEALASMGVTMGSGTDELSTLAAAVYRHGGTYGIDAVADSYRAEIRPEQPRAEGPAGTGFGSTPTVALAFALVDALADDEDATLAR